RSRSRGRCLRRRLIRLLLRRRLLVRLLLFQIADALVLGSLHLRLLILAPGPALAGHVRATAYHGGTNQRASPEHHYLPAESCLGYTSSGRDSPRATMSSGAAAMTLGPPTCGATA